MRKKMIRHICENYNASGNAYLKQAELYEIFEFFIDGIKCVAHRIYRFEKFENGEWVENPAFAANSDVALCINKQWSDLEVNLTTGRQDMPEGYYDIYSIEVIQDFTEMAASN